jgi:hypothetical protein
MISHVLDARERELRHRAYLAAPLMSEQFPGVRELAVRFRFNDPDGKAKPQPYAQLFAPDMRAFFRFQCPLKECTGGGFDLHAAVPRGLARKGAVTRGSLTCAGKRTHPRGETRRCNLHVDYQVAVQGQRSDAV